MRRRYRERDSEWHSSSRRTWQPCSRRWRRRPACSSWWRTRARWRSCSDRIVPPRTGSRQWARRPSELLLSLGIRRTPSTCDPLSTDHHAQRWPYCICDVYCCEYWAIRYRFCKCVQLDGATTECLFKNKATIVCFDRRIAINVKFKMEEHCINIHRVTVTQFRFISMPAGFRRHLVGKTLRNVCYSDVS